MANVFPKTRVDPLLCLAVAVLHLVSTGKSDELQEIGPCTYVSSDWADGDSFLVKLPDGNQEVFRLYFVDCIEQSANDLTDKRRLREQSRYFGVEEIKIALEHGAKAAELTAKALSKPFTVHTNFASAMGRSAKPRFYAFIRTSEGKDLGRLLIENGLARTVGIGRETPDGTHRDDWSDFLRDIELSSAIKGKGIWAHSNPEMIVSMRKEEREEMRLLESIDDALTVTPPTSPIDLNTASIDELMRSGLREALADEVVKKRPFSNIEDLLEIRGIGPATLEKVKPYLTINNPESIKPAP